MRGALPSGEVTIFDDDHYYMAAVIAVRLARAGARVTYVTTTGRAAAIAFAKEGVKVVVAGRREAEGAKTVELVEQVGGMATFVRCDS